MGTKCPYYSLGPKPHGNQVSILQFGAEVPREPAVFTAVWGQIPMGTKCPYCSLGPVPHGNQVSILQLGAGAPWEPSVHTAVWGKSPMGTKCPYCSFIHPAPPDPQVLCTVHVPTRIEKQSLQRLHHNKALAQLP